MGNTEKPILARFQTSLTVDVRPVAVLFAIFFGFRQVDKEPATNKAKQRAPSSSDWGRLQPGSQIKGPACAGPFYSSL